MWKEIVEITIQVVIIYLVVAVLVIIQLILVDDKPYLTQEVNPLTIKTGDLLGVSYRNPFGWLVTAATNSVWTHTGIAWRSPITNELFVFESAMYNGKYKGVFRIPFDLWIHINRKHDLCYLELSGTVDAHKMEEICIKLERITLETFNWEWYRLLMQRPYTERMMDHYTCYEITILCLQKLGVVKKELAASSYFPRDIICRHLPMEEGYRYANPISITRRYIPV